MLNQLKVVLTVLISISWCVKCAPRGKIAILHNRLAIVRVIGIFSGFRYSTHEFDFEVNASFEHSFGPGFINIIVNKPERVATLNNTKPS
jgi:hypothetical protein